MLGIRSTISIKMNSQLYLGIKVKDTTLEPKLVLMIYINIYVFSTLNNLPILAKPISI
jgi:hypothetical protein